MDRTQIERAAATGRAFTLITTDDRRIPIISRDSYAFSPDGNKVMLFDDKDEVTTLTMEEISRVECHFREEY
jgi:hypothetical protein